MVVRDGVDPSTSGSSDRPPPFQASGVLISSTFPEPRVSSTSSESLDERRFGRFFGPNLVLIGYRGKQSGLLREVPGDSSQRGQTWWCWSATPMTSALGET